MSDVIIVRAMGGVGFAFFWPITEILVLDLAPRDRRVREMGYYSVSWGSAFLIGPLVGGFIIQYLGFFNLFLISSLMIMFAFVEIGFTIFPGRSRSTVEPATVHSLRKSDIMKGLLPWYIMVAFYGIVFSILTTIFPAYANSIGFGPILVGALFAGFGVARVFAYATSEHYLRFGERRALIAASLLISAGCIAIVLLPSFIYFLVTISIIGGCFAVIFTLSLSLISRHFSRGEVGTAVGMYESVYGMGCAIGPVVAGALAAFSNAKLSFIGASFFAASMGIIVTMAKIHRED